MNMRCNHCKKDIEIDTRYAGQEMECPFCRHLFICPKGVASPIPPAPPVVYREPEIKRSVAWITICILLVIWFGGWLIIKTCFYIYQYSNIGQVDFASAARIGLSLGYALSCIWDVGGLFAILGICSFIKYLIRK